MSQQIKRKERRLGPSSGELQVSSGVAAYPEGIWNRRPAYLFKLSGEGRSSFLTLLAFEERQGQFAL